MYMLKSPEGITFNHVDLQERFTDADNALYDYFMVNDVAGRGVNGKEIELITVSNNDGAYVEGGRKPPRYLDVTITVKSPSFSDLRRKIDELNDILNTREDVPIVFDDETDMTYYGRLDSVNNLTEEHKIYQAVLTFLCSDPYKYGPEVSKDLGDVDTVNNEGTVSANPIFELTAMEKATFAMISNGADEDAEYNLIGTPADVDEQLVDTRTLLLEERGQTLDTWTDVGTEVDGTVDGTLGTDSDGITVPSYGTDTPDWHGPALMKEVTPAQDFEVQMGVQGRITEVQQTYRIEFYLFDENMNQLGKMAILDRSQNIAQYQAEGRYGGSTGHEYYPISSRNYQVKHDHYFGMLRMIRIGNKFEFYVTRINNNNQHVRSLKETYIDSANEFVGRLKYVQIHIGKYADTPRAYAPKIHYIKAFRLSQATVDQTPYILDAGDVVTFDHKNEDILINGEPRNDLKNFGGSFFKLKKGYNSLIVHPSDTFDSKVIYSNKYL